MLAFGTVLGLLVGGVVGLLNAPTSGAALRQQVADAAARVQPPALAELRPKRTAEQSIEAGKIAARRLQSGEIRP
jgi:gas vesicle protein